MFMRMACSNSSKRRQRRKKSETKF